MSRKKKKQTNKVFVYKLMSVNNLRMFLICKFNFEINFENELFRIELKFN